MQGEIGDVLARVFGTIDTELTAVQMAMREDGNAPDVSGIRMAYMERDGSISVVPGSSGPKVLEVSVEDGVQTVRIALE